MSLYDCFSYFFENSAALVDKKHILTVVSYLYYIIIFINLYYITNIFAVFCMYTLYSFFGSLIS